MKRYDSLYEMAYKKEAYEQKIITPNMLNFIRHMIKLKLCDETYGNLFDKNLSIFAKKYQIDWMHQAAHLCGVLFRKLNEAQIDKPGTKEKSYLSVLDNMKSEIDNPYGAKQAIKDATTKFKYKDNVKDNFEKYSIYNLVEDEAWFKEIIQFLFSLKPIVNFCIIENEAKEKATHFISEFIKVFKK